MLENIKSVYFVKNIFSFIREKRILKLVKNNKCLQTKIDKSLINYKNFSAKYISNDKNENLILKDIYYRIFIFEEGILYNHNIYERKGEYDKNDKQIIEAKFLNGEYIKGKFNYDDFTLSDIKDIIYKKNKNFNFSDIDNNILNQSMKGKGLYGCKENLINQVEVLNAIL